MRGRRCHCLTLYPSGGYNPPAAPMDRLQLSSAGATVAVGQSFGDGERDGGGTGGPRPLKPCGAGKIEALRGDHPWQGLWTRWRKSRSSVYPYGWPSRYSASWEPAPVRTWIAWLRRHRRASFPRGPLV